MLVIFWWREEQREVLNFNGDRSIDFSFEDFYNASKFRKSFSLWMFDKYSLLFSVHRVANLIIPKQGSDHITLLLKNI